MSAIFRLTNRALLQRSLAMNNALKLSRTIKTSQKKDDTAAVAAPPSVTKEDFANPNPKNWVSYGFEYKSESDDRKATKTTFFVTITLCIVWATFFWNYMPDVQLRDWAQREAYLELRRREQAGADLVNPNYVNPESIALPSEEELGDTEIII